MLQYSRQAQVFFSWRARPIPITESRIRFRWPEQERQLREDKPPGALSWYLNREQGHLLPDGSLSPRRLWSNDLILPPKVGPPLPPRALAVAYSHFPSLASS
jgi:hypothetical protein